MTEISVNRADVVFVGLLVALDDVGLATFDVEDVWSGTQAVAGEPIDVATPTGMLQLPPGSAASRYLVLARDIRPVLESGFIDCSNYPFSWDPSYAEFRPAGASPPPAPEGTDPAGPPIALLALIGAGAVLLIVGGLAFRSKPREP